MALTARPTALVLRALGLGDLLTGVPALRGLRRALPGHELVLAAPAALEPLARLSGAVDSVLDTRGLSPLSGRCTPPDVAVDLHGRGPQSHRVLQATGPRRLVGFACPEAGVSGPAWAEGEREHDRWCRLVREGLGADAHPGDLDLSLPSARAPVSAAVVVHPGAAYPSRRWPPERFGAVASALARDGERVVVTGTAGERPLASRVAALAGLPAGAVLAGRTTVEEMAAVVAAARLVVCGDTGTAHLATAFGTPSVVLFGPVTPRSWGPPADRPQHVVLAAEGVGRGDPWGELPDPALLRIRVEDALAAARGLLDGCPASLSQSRSRSLDPPPRASAMEASR